MGLTTLKLPSSTHRYSLISGVCLNFVRQNFEPETRNPKLIASSVSKAKRKNIC
jgi:hypothetical protein